MTEPITIVIPGTTASYQKAVGTWRSKDGRSGTLAYDKKSYGTWRTFARSRAAEAMGDRPLIQGPITIEVNIYRAIPTSLSRKKHDLAIAGALVPITKPDISNNLKAIEDAALSGIVIPDDRYIVSATVNKRFSDKPRVEITVRAWVASVIMAAPPQDGLFGQRG